MALIYTPSIFKKTTMPQFTLPTVDGRSWSSAAVQNAKVKVFVFMCNHCPYVKAIENRLIKLAQFCIKLEVPFIGICANDASEYPEDSAENLLKNWQEKKFGFDYLLDTHQSVARTFDAVCTPDFFVFNISNVLTYRGRLDDSWRDESKVKNEELKDAILFTMSNPNDEISNQKPSMGCSIKWIT